MCGNKGDNFINVLENQTDIPKIPETSEQPIEQIIENTLEKGDEILLLEDKFSVFKKYPDSLLSRDQMKIIYGFSPEFRQKMIDIGLKYNNEVVGNETIEIILDGEKIVFDKNQAIKGEVSYTGGLKEVKKLSKEAFDSDLAEKIVQIFKGKQEVLGISSEIDGFWTSSLYDSYTKYSYYASFKFGNVTNRQQDKKASIICRNKLHDPEGGSGWINPEKILEDKYKVLGKPNKKQIEKLESLIKRDKRYLDLFINYGIKFNNLEEGTIGITLPFYGEFIFYTDLLKKYECSFNELEEAELHFNFHLELLSLKKDESSLGLLDNIKKDEETAIDFGAKILIYFFNN